MIKKLKAMAMTNPDAFVFWITVVLGSIGLFGMQR